MKKSATGSNGEEPPAVVWGGSYSSTCYYLHFVLCNLNKRPRTVGADRAQDEGREIAK
jgi:hypothetical protein